MLNKYTDKQDRNKARNKRKNKENTEATTSLRVDFERMTGICYSFALICI